MEILYHKISNSQKPKLPDERFDTWVVYRPVYDEIHLRRLVKDEGGRWNSKRGL